MYRKFKPLNIPDGWEQYWSKYPNGYTIMEALIDWVSQVDDMVNNQNELTDTVKSFGERIDDFINQFGDSLANEVQELLTEWQTSGFLDVVISSALQWQLDDYITTNEQDKVSITAQLQQMVIKVDETLVTDGDWTNAINTALNSVNGNATVIFPINSSVTIKSPLLIKSGTTIDGSNAKISVVGNFRPFLVNGTDNEKISDVHLNNLDITLNGTGTNQAAVSFENAENCTYKNIIIKNPGLNGVEIIKSQNITGEKISVLSPKAFGIFYFMSENCTDKNCYIYEPTLFGHQFKSSKNCKSYDITVIRPLEEHGLYMWSGFGEGVPAPQKNEFCSYIRPYVEGAETSKHLIYINASPNCSVIDPVLIQKNGGWGAVSVNGTNQLEGGGIVSATGFTMTGAKIITVWGTQAIGIVGGADNVIAFTLRDIALKGVGDKPLYLDYSTGAIENITIDDSTFDKDCVFVQNSKVSFNKLTIYHSNARGVYVGINSDVTFTNCDIRNTILYGVQAVKTAKIKWLSGRIFRAREGSLLLQCDESFIGGGSSFVDGRYNAVTVGADITITGKNNIVSGFFTKNELSNLDNYIKELNGAYKNKFTIENIFLPELVQNILLHTLSESTVY